MLSEYFMFVYNNNSRIKKTTIDFGLTIWCWSSNTFSVSVSKFEWASLAVSIDFDANGFNIVRIIVFRMFGWIELNNFNVLLLDEYNMSNLEEL